MALRRAFGWSRWAFVAMGIAMVAVACGRGTAAGPTPTTLRIGFGFGGPRSGSLDYFADSLLGDPLVSPEWNGRDGPRLADGWHWTADRLGLLLHLRAGVRYHDGTELTAAVAQRILNQSIYPPGNLPPPMGYERVVGVNVADDRTVEIRLRSPDAFLLSELGNSSFLDVDRKSVGTGPFKVVERGVILKFEANDLYWRGRPSLDRVEIHPYQTLRSAWSAMMRGEVDFLPEVNRNAVGFVQAESTIRTYSTPRAYYLPLVFNVRHPVLGRQEVRQALSRGVDRDAIVKLGLYGQGKPAEGPIWPYHWAYAAARRSYAYSPEAARLQLENAGLPVRPVKGDGGPGSMPSRFRFTSLFLDDPQFERVALVLQRQLAQIGVDMVLEPVTQRDLIARVEGGRFDAFLFQMTSGRSLNWAYRFWHSPLPGVRPMFRSGYLAADAALDMLRAAQSDDDTRRGISELQRALYEDPPAVFLAWMETTRALDAKFEAPVDDTPDILGSLWHWRTGPAVHARR